MLSKSSLFAIAMFVSKLETGSHLELVGILINRVSHFWFLVGSGQFKDGGKQPSTKREAGNSGVAVGGKKRRK